MYQKTAQGADTGTPALPRGNCMRMAKSHSAEPRNGKQCGVRPDPTAAAAELGFGAYLRFFGRYPRHPLEGPMALA